MSSHAHNSQDPRSGSRHKRDAQGRRIAGFRNVTAKLAQAEARCDELRVRQLHQKARPDSVDKVGKQSYDDLLADYKDVSAKLDQSEMDYEGICATLDEYDNAHEQMAGALSDATARLQASQAELADLQEFHRQTPPDLQEFQWHDASP
jgi:chromosome segregation ATPase